MKKTILLVVTLATFLGIAFWIILKTGVINLNRINPSDEMVELKYWNLWEDENFIKPVIDNYQLSHPKVKIIYTKQSFVNYRTRAQTQVRAGTGPDVFPLHSSWMLLFLSDISPAPSITLSSQEFQQTYFPMASEIASIKGKVYGIPLELDGLVLYYNEDILKAVGVNPPTSWQEFIDGATKMTVKNTAGQIQTAGAALGTTTNIDFWPEIIGTLFLQQPNGNLSDPASVQGAEVLKFYTNFVLDPKIKTWDITLSSSTSMFTQGQLAYYFAPESKINEMKLANPNLNFKTTIFPQLSEKKVAWGSFWLNAVSATSSHPKEAWEFAKYLSSSDVLQYIYQKKGQQGELGKVYPRVDLAPTLLSDNYLGAFVKEGPYYKGWYLNSNVLDAGINEEMIGVYKVAVDGVLSGLDPLTSLQSISPKVSEILTKYQVK